MRIFEEFKSIIFVTYFAYLKAYRCRQGEYTGPAEGGDVRLQETRFLVNKVDYINIFVNKVYLSDSYIINQISTDTGITSKTHCIYSLYKGCISTQEKYSSKNNSQWSGLEKS